MMSWWSQLNERERRLVGIGGPLLLLAIIYWVPFDPLPAACAGGGTPVSFPTEYPGLDGAEGGRSVSCSLLVVTASISP